jgi:hypothetical protein
MRMDLDDESLPNFVLQRLRDHFNTTSMMDLAWGLLLWTRSARPTYPNPENNELEHPYQPGAAHGGAVI